MRRNFWNLLSMTGAVKTSRVYFIFLPMVFLGSNYSRKYDREEDMHFSSYARTFIEIALKMLQRLNMVSQIESFYFPIIYQKPGYWIDL